MKFNFLFSVLSGSYTFPFNIINLNQLNKNKNNNLLDFYKYISYYKLLNNNFIYI